MPGQFTVDIFPLLPLWAVVLAMASLLALVAWGVWVLARKDVPRRWVFGLGAARALAVLLFAACLLQPTISYLHTRPQPPELVLLIDASQSMGQADSSDGGTRLAQATKALQHFKLLEKLGDKFEVKPFAFDRRAWPLELADIDSLQPKDATTDFAASLASSGDLLAAERSDQSSVAAPRRVLLVSDGQDRGNENFAEAAERAGVVVDVLPAGAEAKATPQTAVIARVAAPSRVLLGSATQFLVAIERGNDAAQTYVLTLFEDGQEVATQEVPLAAAVREHRTSVQFQPSQAGLKRYEFALQPQNAPAASTSRYAVNVQVSDDQIEVLVLEDRWRWEFKYFKRVLEDDPSFSLTAMLARGNGAFLQMGEPDRRVSLGSFPQSRAELDWFDVLVLGDVRTSRWPSGLSGAIADAVIEEGKSLIVIAGPSLGELSQSPELHTLLPVELSIDSAMPIEGPLDVRLTPEGADSGLFADGDGAATITLPAVDRIFAPLRKRPAATVLVEAASEANASGRLILLAEQTVGRGRVLYVGTDALWKWQTLTPLDEAGRTIYGKFWQQMLRAQTPSRTSAAPLWLTADHSRYEAGDRVTLRAEPGAATESERMELTATIVLPDERRLPLAFEPDPAQPAGYRAAFDAPVPGRYRIALTATTAGQMAGATSIAVEVTGARGEIDDAGVDRAALAEIAARTGGKVVNPADPTTWPTPGKAAPPRIEERKIVNLWENFSLLTLLCLVLGGDWLFRQLLGYL